MSECYLCQYKDNNFFKSHVNKDTLCKKHSVWRVGRKLGRTLYLNDECVGMVDTKELAEKIVRAMNK